MPNSPSVRPVNKPVSLVKNVSSSGVALRPGKPVGAPPLVRLGGSERLILSYLGGGDLAYQFRIVDVARGVGLSSKAVYSALRRLMARGIVVKRARGVYALAPWVIDLFNNGFTVSPVVEPEDKPEENLGGGGVGGWGVVRVHVAVPGGGWLRFFVALFFVRLLVDFAFKVAYGRLVGVYGPWRLRVVMSRVRSLFSYFVYYSKSTVLGCHGRYNGSPGGFSPLEDCVHGASYYEHGLDFITPGWLAEALDELLSIFKVYVKAPGDVKEGNPGYYAKLLSELGEPPPAPVNQRPHNPLNLGVRI